MISQRIDDVGSVCMVQGASLDRTCVICVVRESTSPWVALQLLSLTLHNVNSHYALAIYIMGCLCPLDIRTMQVTEQPAITPTRTKMSNKANTADQPPSATPKSTIEERFTRPFIGSSSHDSTSPLASKQRPTADTPIPRIQVTPPTPTNECNRKLSLELSKPRIEKDNGRTVIRQGNQSLVVDPTDFHGLLHAGSTCQVNASGGMPCGTVGGERCKRPT